MYMRLHGFGITYASPLPAPPWRGRPEEPEPANEALQNSKPFTGGRSVDIKYVSETHTYTHTQIYIYIYINICAA